MAITIADIQNEIINRYSDTPEEILFYFINAAIKYVNDSLIAAKDSNTIKKLAITTTTTKPSDFINLAPANGYPVEVTDTQIIPLQSGTINIKYYFDKSQITTTSDAFPLPDKYVDIVVKHVISNLKMGADYDVSDDNVALDRNLSADVKTKGG